MELSEYIGTLRRRWLLIAALGLIGAVVGFGLAQSSPRMYKSSSSVFVSTQRGDTTTELVQGSTFTQNLIQSYAQLAQMPSVLDPVITSLKLDTTAHDLARSISADAPLNTVLINITVVDASPTQAAKVANAVASSLATTVQAFSPKSASGASAVVMKLVAEAQPPEEPFTPNTRLMTATGLGIGLVLAVVYALGRQVIDTRIRSDADLRRVTELPLLGRIGNRGRKPGPKAVFKLDPHGPDAESFRRLAANLQFINPDSAVRSVVVTSALPHEGKSSTAINLALALAERFERVLLVDADLRRPMIAHYCGIEGDIGLTTVLSGSAELSEAIEPWGSIDVLPAGAVPPNPNQLSTSNAMADTVSTLISDYDIVVIDSAPLIPVADSLPLTRFTDGALVVAMSNATRRGQLRTALESVEAVNGSVLGLILNRVKRTKAKDHYGYEPQNRSGIRPAPEHRQLPGSAEPKPVHANTSS